MASRDRDRRLTTPTHPGSQGSAQRGSSSAIRSYLQPVTTLDGSSQDMLKALLRITIDLRRNTSLTGRIQRGSPRSGALGSALAQLQPRVNSSSGSLEQIFAAYERFPGMYLVKSQFATFKDILNSDFNDGGNDGGYSERVHLLEKLMYVTGMLRGHLEMVLEQHSYWKAKLAGEQPPRLVRRLDFNRDIDPAATQQSLGGGLQFVPVGVSFQLSNANSATSLADSAHDEGSPPSAPSTFKGPLPLYMYMYMYIIYIHVHTCTCTCTCQCPLHILPSCPSLLSPSCLSSFFLSFSPSHPFPTFRHLPTVSVSLPEEVQTTLVSLWENQKYTDITFLINSHPVPAHKAILASQSEYFERMLFGELREASMDEIPLHDVPLEAFQNVLHYAYSGTLHMRESTLQVSRVPTVLSCIDILHILG